MAANGPKRPQKVLGRLHKGGYVATNPVPEAVRRNARERKETEDILSEIEEDSGLSKILSVLERRNGD
jgi:hypothetical protein